MLQLCYCLNSFLKHTAHFWDSTMAKEAATILICGLLLVAVEVAAKAPCRDRFLWRESVGRMYSRAIPRRNDRHRLLRLQHLTQALSGTLLSEAMLNTSRRESTVALMQTTGLQLKFTTIKSGLC